MPHVIVEYSANLEPELEIESLLAALHETALATGLFDRDGIRSRALRRDVFRIADGAPENGFVYVIARIGEGRPAEARADLGQRLLAAVEQHFGDALTTTPVSLGAEVQEIERAMTFRRNTIRELRNAAKG